MKPMILIGADYGDFASKQVLKEWLAQQGYPVQDCGAASLDPNDDYPLVVEQVAAAMQQFIRDKRSAFAILLCRSGAGMSMAANRYTHLRAVTALSEEQARHARNDDDANVLSLPADWLSQAELQAIVAQFLTTPFSQAERHSRRVDQLSKLGSQAA